MKTIKADVLEARWGRCQDCGREVQQDNHFAVTVGHVHSFKGHEARQVLTFCAPCFDRMFPWKTTV